VVISAHTKMKQAGEQIKA